MTDTRTLTLGNQTFTAPAINMLYKGKKPGEQVVKLPEPLAVSRWPSK